MIYTLLASAAHATAPTLLIGALAWFGAVHGSTAWADDNTLIYEISTYEPACLALYVDHTAAELVVSPILSYHLRPGFVDAVQMLVRVPEDKAQDAIQTLLGLPKVFSAQRVDFTMNGSDAEWPIRFNPNATGLNMPSDCSSRIGTESEQMIRAVLTHASEEASPHGSIRDGSITVGVIDASFAGIESARNAGKIPAGVGFECGPLADTIADCVDWSSPSPARGTRLAETVAGAAPNATLVVGMAGGGHDIARVAGRMIDAHGADVIVSAVTPLAAGGPDGHGSGVGLDSWLRAMGGAASAGVHWVNAPGYRGNGSIMQVWFTDDPIMHGEHLGISPLRMAFHDSETENTVLFRGNMTHYFVLLWAGETLDSEAPANLELRLNCRDSAAISSGALTRNGGARGPVQTMAAVAYTPTELRACNLTIEGVAGQPPPAWAQLVSIGTNMEFSGAHTNTPPSAKDDVAPSPGSRPLADIGMHLGKSVGYRVFAHDPDEGDTLQIAATSSNGNVVTVSPSITHSTSMRELIAGGPLYGTLYLAPHSPGVSVITVFVTDGWHTTNGTFAVTVADNHYPKLANYARMAPLLYPDSGTAILRASDADGDRLTYRAYLPPGVTELVFSMNGNELTATPLPGMTGMAGWSDGAVYGAPIIVEVSDGEAYDYMSVLVCVTGINEAPKSVAVPDQTIRQGESVSIQISASDADGDYIAFATPIPSDRSVVHATLEWPDVLTLDYDGYSEARPGRDMVDILDDGSISITALGRDSNGAVFLFSMNATNPVFTIQETLPPVDAVRGCPHRLDADGAAQDKMLLTGMSVGSTAVVLQAADPWGGYDEQTFTVTVVPAEP